MGNHPKLYPSVLSTCITRGCDHACTPAEAVATTGNNGHFTLDRMHSRNDQVGKVLEKEPQDMARQEDGTDRFIHNCRHNSSAGSR